MVDDLTRGDRIRVHQALHGYSDGHRLLASSIALKSRDAKAMLVLSDASGPGAAIEHGGYLTGYPLLGSGLYAFARTWAAREMPRPGCVWTHTLLVDVADVGALPTLGVLRGAFRRPTPTFPPSGYDASLTLDVVGDTTPADLDDDWRAELRPILWALYGRPRDRIISSSGSIPGREAIVVALWDQQWPRLRRSFRFCTLALADRSTDGAPFDLQFVPSKERAARARFAATVDADRIQPDPILWLDDALADASEGVDGSLRAFLRQAGSDVADGRQAFAPLSRLYRLLRDFDKGPAAIDEAVAVADGALGTALGRAAQALVTSAAVAHPELLSDEALAFVVHHLDLLGPDDKRAETAAAALWSRDPTAVGRLLTADPPLRSIAERALTRLPTPDLVKGLRRSPGVGRTVLARRPEVLADPGFWTLPDSCRAEALAFLARETAHIDSALEAMLLSASADLAADATRVFGPGRVFPVVATWLEGKGSEEPAASDAAWLVASLKDGGSVAQNLSRGLARARTTLVAIARSTHPDFVPNDYGEDPWWTAMRGAVGNVSQRGREYLSAYLVARALGHRSRNQAELISAGFDDIYLAALQSRLSGDAWELMENRLSRSRWGFDWDHCQLLRVAVVKAFVERDLSPLSFGQVTAQDEVFEDLVKTAARNGRGRAFLRRVRAAMREDSGDHFEQRLRLIEDAL